MIRSTLLFRNYASRLKILVANHFSVPLHRNTYLLSINLLVTFVSGIAFWILASRLLHPAQIGIANAFLSPTSFLSMAFLFGANFSILRFNNDIVNDPKLLYGILWTALFASIFGAVLGAVIFFASHIIYPIANSYLLSVFLYVVAISGNVIWTLSEAAFVGMNAPMQLLFRNILFGILRVLILLPFAGWGETGLVISYALGSGFAALLCVDMIRRYLHSPWSDFFTFSHPAVKTMMGFALSNHVANLIGSIPGMVLPLIVFHMLGAEINGYFTLAWTITLAARAVLTAASSTLLAEGSRNGSLIGTNLIRSTLFLMSIIGTITIPLAVFPRLVMLPFGAVYTDANQFVLPTLALSSFPAVLVTVFVASERILKRIRYVLIVAIFNSLFSAILPFVGAYYYGYTGFSIGYLAAQGVLAISVLPAFIKMVRRV